MNIKHIKRINEIINNEQYNSNINDEIKELINIFSIINIVDLYDYKEMFKNKPYSLLNLLVGLRPDVVSSLIKNNAIDINKEANIDFEKTWQIIKHLINRNLVDQKMLSVIKEKYSLDENSNTHDEERLNSLFKSVKTLNTLKFLEKNGFNIWRVIQESENVETLLPCVVLLRNRKHGFIDGDEQVNFFLLQREKWMNISTDKTSNQEFKSRVLISLSHLEPKLFTRLVNNIGDVNLNTKYYINGNEFTGYEFLLIKNKHDFVSNKLNKDLKNINKDNLFNMWSILLRSPPGNNESIFKNHKGKILKRGGLHYQKIWDMILNSGIDVNYTVNDFDIVENIFHTYENIIKTSLFIPIEFKDVSSFYMDEVFLREESKTKSISKLMYFLDKNNYDFLKINKKTNRLKISDMILYIASINNLSKANDAIDIILKNINKSNIEVKTEILNNFIDDLNLILNKDRIKEYTDSKFPEVLSDSSIIFKMIYIMKDIIMDSSFTSYSISKKLTNNEKIIDILSIGKYESLYKDIKEIENYSHYLEMNAELKVNNTKKSINKI